MKKITKFLSVVLAIVLSVFTFACSQTPPPAKSEYGEIKNIILVDDYVSLILHVFIHTISPKKRLKEILHWS